LLLRLGSERRGKETGTNTGNEHSPFHYSIT